MRKKNKNKNSSIFLDDEIEDTQNLELDKDIEQSIEIVNRNKEELEDERNQRINGKFERTANGQMIVQPKIRYKVNFNAIICICILVIILAWLIIDFGPIFGINITGSDSLTDNMIELVTKESDIYGMYDEDLFVYSNNTINVYNEKSEVVWTYTFSESFIPSIVTNGNYMLVSNNSTGMIYLFANRKEILNKKIDGEIKNTFIDKFGNMAIEYTVDSSHTDMISVYDNDGEEKYHFYHNNIVSMEMLDDASRMIFTETITDSSNIGIKFNIVDISKSESEQIKEIVSLDNQFVYDFIVSGDKIYALLDDKIVSIDTNSGNVKTLKEFDTTQMLFVALNDKYFNYVQRDIENGDYVIENVNYSGNVICSTKVDSVPKVMVNSDFVNYYIYQDYVYIQNRWGVELNSKEISFTPNQAVVFNNNKSLALIYTNKIYILNI